jgi:hypothetical protein
VGEAEEGAAVVAEARGKVAEVLGREQSMRVWQAFAWEESMRMGEASAWKESKWVTETAALPVWPRRPAWPEIGSLWVLLPGSRLPRGRRRTRPRVQMSWAWAAWR